MTIFLPQKKNDLKLKSLRGKNKIDYLFENGLSAHSTSLLLKFKLDGNSLFKEYCVSVSKKNFPLAVDRNKIKRLLREIIRKNSNSFPTGQFLFIYKRSGISSFSSLCEEIKKLLNAL